LLFSFQRPSSTPRSEKLLSSRALTAAESRRLPFCVRGSAFYRHPFVASSPLIRSKSRRLPYRVRGSALLPPPLPCVKRFTLDRLRLEPPRSRAKPPRGRPSATSPLT